MLRRNLLAAVLLAGCAGAPPKTPRPSGPAEAHAVVTYDVTEQARGILDVRIRVPAGGFGHMTIEDGALRFIDGLEVRDANGAPAHATIGEGEVSAPACEQACTVRYRFELGQAASIWKNPQYAAEIGGALLAPPTTWLLYPTKATDEPFELSVHANGFTTGLGVRPSGRYGAQLSDLPEAPYSAFGVTRKYELELDGAVVTLAIVGLDPWVGDARLAQWARESAEDIRAFYGKFSAAPALVLAVVEAGDDIGAGTALGNGGASILVHVGEEVEEQTLREDWILTHEMVHLSMPGLHARHHWMEEGMATYLEPILRARRGRLSEERVWKEWYASMGYGLPLEGDGGLDGTQSWGRLYWGGATFWFLADIAIRRETHGARSLRDCLSAIEAAGGTIAVRWGIDHFVDTCDAGVGAPIVRGLYEKYGKQSEAVDLDALFSSLGVKRRRGGVEFDLRAPEAAIRATIAAPVPL